MAQFNPQPFGKYYLVDKLAVGGMAEIFLAKPTQGATTGPRYIVIKRILPHFSTNAQFIDMFIDEAKISVQLEHENIVPVFDLGKIGETYFLAMEFVAGQDLKAVLTRCRDRGVRLSYEHAAYIVGELLKGLDYAHKKTDRGGRPLNIVHRDISPQNVLVGYDGSVKLTDFGIAKAESKLDSTQVGTLKGKFGYMAPEQVVAGGPPLDLRSDIFAAGIILWELMTGHRLFSGSSEIEILERVRSARFDPPSALVPDVPRELERVVFQALMKDRDHRYRTAADMQNDLAAFLDSYAPEFAGSEMAAVMDELFAPEIALVKSRWNVVIGPVIDKAKVERGAVEESTRPDRTKVTDEPVVKTRVATPIPHQVGEEATATARLDTKTARLSPPDDGAMLVTARAASPTVVSAPPRPAITTARTQIRQPDPVLQVEDLFPDSGGDPFLQGGVTMQNEIPRRADPGPPRAPKPSARPEPPPPAERTDPVPVPVRPPPPPPPGALDRDFAPGRMDGASRVAPFQRQQERKPLVRGSVLLVLGLLVAATMGALVWMDVFPNPFAPPIIEVASTVDALITIDGNVVLASGRTGEWRVGDGKRLVEVKREGYLPFARTVEVGRGRRVFVDAVLIPRPDALSDIPVISTPNGAQVYLDAELQGVTPITLHARIGDHTLRVSLPGYGEEVRALRAGHPGLGTAAEFALVPTAASVMVTTVPPQAEVFVDGTSRGRTPVTLDGLTPGKPVVITVVLKGYQNESRTVTPPGGRDPTQVPIPLVPVAPEQKASPGGTVAVQPVPIASQAVPGNAGFLSVDVPGSWGEVYVDDSRVSPRTPMVKLPLSPGTHTVRVVNPASGREKTFEVGITTAKTTVRHVTLE